MQGTHDECRLIAFTADQQIIYQLLLFLLGPLALGACYLLEGPSKACTFQTAYPDIVLLNSELLEVY